MSEGTTKLPLGCALTVKQISVDCLKVYKTTACFSWYIMYLKVDWKSPEVRYTREQVDLLVSSSDNNDYSQVLREVEGK